MKKLTHLIIVLFVGLAPLSAYAAIAVDVSNNCVVKDTTNTEHTFPKSDSPSNYLGICLLAAAKEASLVNFTLTNDSSFGLYIQSVNGTNPGSTEYWALWKNGASSSCGIGCTPLVAGDTISLILTDWMSNVESTTVSFSVQSLIAPPPPRSSISGGGIPQSKLSVENTLVYLASTQQEDGSFGPLFLSDWVAIAFAAVDPGEAKAKLRKYFLETIPTLSKVTDYERHAMALLALGINPYSGTPVNYIAPIVHAFDGKQIGDPHLDNDDIFALFPLLSAGYTTYDPIIQKTAASIVSAQQRNGSWDGSIDMTAAAIQALVPVRILPDVSLALIRAEGYLRSEKPSNSFSTSWVRQATSALSWTPSGWAENSFTEKDYLAELQQSDGGIEPESSDVQTRVWASAYAVPAALGKSWPMLLQSFEKQNIPEKIDTAPPVIQPAATTTITTPSIASVPTTPSLQEKQKVEVPLTARSLPLLIDRQTAAVASAPTGSLFKGVWDSMVAFFTHW